MALEGRGENWLPSLCCSGCSACKATLGHLSSSQWCLSLGNSVGSVWECCSVLSCRVRQQEVLAPSKSPSPGQQGDALAAYVLCSLGLCAKPFWDGQEMTQQTPNCEALAGRASLCFGFSDIRMRSLTVFRHWRFLLRTLAVLSPSSASHKQRGRRKKGGLLMCLS